MPRFVILTHDFPELHWDLMLEQGEVLRTWRLAERPVAGMLIEAEALANHRRHYLDYEGPVSGGRGSVTRFASGNYVVEQETAFELRIRLVCEGLPPVALLRQLAGGKWSVEFISA